MQFQVPQFIEVENKIFGPFTFKQFIYLAGGAGISFVLYIMLPLFIAVLFIIPTVGLALALAFYKVNNKPFIYMVEAAFRYTIGDKLYTWKKRPRKKEEESAQTAAPSGLYVPKLSDSKLKDLSWSLDVHKEIG